MLHHSNAVVIVIADVVVVVVVVVVADCGGDAGVVGFVSDCYSHCRWQHPLLGLQGVRVVGSLVVWRCSSILPFEHDRVGRDHLSQAHRFAAIQSIVGNIFILIKSPLTWKVAFHMNAFSDLHRNVSLCTAGNQAFHLSQK